MRLIPYSRTEVPSRIWPNTASLFDEVFNGPFFSGLTAERWLPPVDVLEKGGDLMLRVEIPGIDEKDIDLKLEGNILTLKGKKELADKQDSGSYHRLESCYGSFTRSFTLPDSADRDAIKADFKNGILTITVPQKPEVKPREIPVTAR